MQIYFFIVIQILDVMTTLLFSKFGFKEINPILNFFISLNIVRPLIDSLVAYKFLCLMILLLLYVEKKSHLLPIINGVFILVPIFNLGWMLYVLRNVSSV